MLNHIVIMGRLTRDPELRHTQSGIAVASFTLAVDRDFQSQNGEKQTDFIDVVAWRQTGEFVSKYFSKGRMAVVSGSLQSRKWQDKEGNNRTSWEVQAQNIYFGDSKRDGDSGSGYQNRSYQNNSYQSGGYQSDNYRSGSAYTSPVTGSDFAELDDDDGDLPF